MSTTSQLDWKVEQGNGQKRDLVEVKNLVKYFPVRGGLLQRVVAWVQAVDNVSFSIKEGETLGLVGESGCGKTTVGRTLLRLVPATGGSVIYDGQDVLKANGREPKACWCTGWAAAASALRSSSIPCAKSASKTITPAATRTNSPAASASASAGL